MLKAVLIDLDNTMVLYDEPAFFMRYFEKLCKAMADLFPAEELMARVIKAVSALQENDGREKNSRFFMKVFMGRRPGAPGEIWQRFMTFYEKDYPRIEADASAAGGLHAVLDRLQRRPLKLVMASNPIYPLIAMEKRMAWAGIETGRFQLLTHMVNMSFVKPRKGYYRQICEAIGEPPEMCLMVGNDPVNDMAAARAGLKTYRTTDAGVVDYASLNLTHGMPVRPPDIPPPDFSGPFADVPLAVATLTGNSPKGYQS